MASLGQPPSFSFRQFYSFSPRRGEEGAAFFVSRRATLHSLQAHRVLSSFGRGAYSRTFREPHETFDWHRLFSQRGAPAFSLCELERSPYRPLSDLFPALWPDLGRFPFFFPPFFLYSRSSAGFFFLEHLAPLPRWAWVAMPQHFFPPAVFRKGCPGALGSRRRQPELGWHCRFFLFPERADDPFT